MAEDQQPAIHEQDTSPTPTHSQTPLTQITSPIIPTDIFTAHSGVPIGHPPPTAQTTSKFDNPARFTALEGMVNHLATNMATNMTELMVMLRNQNQASSSFTPPSEHRPIVDPNPTIPPTLVSNVEDASFSAMAFAPTVHPISDSLPPPPAPTAVPLSPAAFLSADSTMHTLPPLTVSMHPPIYTVPPPTVPPVVLAQAPAPMADHFPFQALQPQTSFPYQALPPLNIPPTQPGMPNQVAPPALPTNIPFENEQERRMKRMEETIRALQADLIEA
ncbi:extensin-like [Punica granatum]|uniref:Extensin-like n=1 Tax=Punica granatum TaxID=22663 RepID=A0A6P8DRA5_PUNGR|nr:extensin-like [Punica granatum]